MQSECIIKKWETNGSQIQGFIFAVGIPCDLDPSYMTASFVLFN